MTSEAGRDRVLLFPCRLPRRCRFGNTGRADARTLSNLPEASSEITAQVREWLDHFAVCVREVDYASARPFWHPDIVIFGTYQELVKSLSAWTERQWDNVWPRTAEFRFDLANTMVMAAPDGAMAVALAPWTSTGFHDDGTAFDRPGRATIVLARQPDGALAWCSFAYVVGPRRTSG